jgi:hypothetical protein
LKTEEYESVKKWFTEGDYEDTTAKKYVEYMDTFCYILNMTPDELANLSPEQALEAQIKLATILKEKLHFREVTVHMRITVLHSFWRYNGLELTEPIKTFAGTSWLKRKKWVK